MIYGVELIQWNILFKVNGLQQVRRVTYGKSDKKFKLSWSGAGAATTWCNNTSNCFPSNQQYCKFSLIAQCSVQEETVSRIGLEAWSWRSKGGRVVCGNKEEWQVEVHMRGDKLMLWERSTAGRLVLAVLIDKGYLIRFYKSYCSVLYLEIAM